ncbi:hypothetical protein BKA56DRAFT_678546 [Ilyonectria sp. MPI-CAGE-AT-0026]|nr:hypothetical protein BKA56DRAFT_678546 [Ilyonectria sp. MPI-CAGE-AT-0026]
MQRTLEPVTLMLTGQSIVAEANPSVPLYELGQGVTALSPKPSSTKFERIEYEDDDLLKEGSIASLDQRSHHLFYLAHSLGAQYRTVSKSLLPKAEFKAVLNPGKSSADSDLFGPANQQVLFHTKPKWKGGQYQWIDAQGQKVAYESSENNEHKLVILEPLDRTTRDALAALWALGLWHGVAESRTAKREGPVAMIVAGIAGFGTWYADDIEPLPAMFRPHHARHYAGAAATAKGIAEIRHRLGEDAVSIDQDDIEEHGFSEWSTSNSPIRPKAIVFPSSTEEVAAVAKICSRYKIPMVPYGAGSSVEGNFSSAYPGVCIDLSRMDKIIEFHPDDLDGTVQAGVNWTHLNAHKEIEESRLFLPLDPSPTAQIGGMIATNCSGTNAMRYGTMKDYVLSVTVALADGSVIKTRSEGTLGIITEATLKLAIVPSDYSVATATFLTVKDAADAASKMIRAGVNLAACELMDDEQMKVVNKSGGAGGKKWEELPTLFLKFSGSRQIIEDSIRAAKDVSSTSRCQSFLSANSKQDMDSLWSARKQAL